jgi:hypothetical protein
VVFQVGFSEDLGTEGTRFESGDVDAD